MSMSRNHNGRLSRKALVLRGLVTSLGDEQLDELEGWCRRTMERHRSPRKRLDAARTLKAVRAEQRKRCRPITRD